MIGATHAMNAGAYGYLSKASAPDLLVGAVRAVLPGPRSDTASAQRCIVDTYDAPVPAGRKLKNEAIDENASGQGLDRRR